MKYKNKPFNKVTVELDGNTFDTCKFKGCVLEFSGGKPPTITNCDLSDSSFSFTDQAADTVQFMKAMYHGGFKEVIEETFEQIRTANKPIKKD